MAENNSFTQNSSVISNLKAIIVIVGAFFVVGFFGIYFSSQAYLKGLKEVNRINNLLDTTTRISESIDSSAENLSKVSSSKSLQDVNYVFQASQKQARENFDLALQQGSHHPEVLKLLKDAKRSFDWFDQSVTILLKAQKKSNHVHEFTKNFLVVKQFEMEAKEWVRKAQIQLKKQGDESFNSVYETRNWPLMVSGAFALLFLVVVLLFGLSIAGRLEQSIKNLTLATDAVSDGKLDYRAEILAQDEIGRLTHAFNQMLISLEEGRNKLNSAFDWMSKLQNVTVALSGALSPDEVVNVVVSCGLAALNAKIGTVSLVNEAGDELRLIRAVGIGVEIQNQWSHYPVSARTMSAEAFRTGKPIFISSEKEAQARYPHYNAIDFSEEKSFTALPLMAGGKTFGAMSIVFSETKKFNPDETYFLLALADQSAQALYRAQLYENAQTAIQTRDEFLSIASHELRTPLTPLKLQLQSLLRGAQNGDQNFSVEQIAKVAKIADRQIVRLVHLIDNLLDVSRINMGKLILHWEEVNLSETVEELIARYEQQALAAHCPLHSRIEPHIVGYFDKIRIEQVLVNLITNAIKYAPGKPIRISLMREKQNARFEIADLGLGIESKDQERIFDRFEQVHATENVGGLGLGLYISRQIVDAHHGKISVKSEFGKGAVFIVQLPLKSEA